MVQELSGKRPTTMALSGYTRPLIWLMLVFTILGERSLVVTAFAPASPFPRPMTMPTTPAHRDHRRSSLLRVAATLPSIPNPLSRLPWNVRKEKERQARRLAVERATLHRQLGIAEDATYEEIVEATQRLIDLAGKDLKQKVKIEVAKDKILQIRLNERLAGLASENKEARAMSNFEVQGTDDDDDGPGAKKKGNSERTAPRWMQGLVVKPDADHVKGQLRLWGIITGVGLAFPPAQDYLGRFTWLVCVAQLTFRGMPKEDREGGGLGMRFNAGGGGSHRKVAFALGFATWVLGAIVVFSALPSWALGQRWTGSLTFSLQNLIFGVVCSYLQPYKG